MPESLRDSLAHSFRALRHRNFRLFASGQFISLIGTWMQTVALGWLVYRLTRSPALLGVAGFLRGLGNVIAWNAGAFGASLVALAVARSEWLACAVLAVSGFGMMAQMAASNTILQTLVDPDKRGRVMSLYAAAMLGTTPLGSLAAGTLAGRIGAPLTVAIGGAACLLAALLFARALPALRAEVRPIYVRLGIIPEIAAGLEAGEEPSSAVTEG
jgi:MFS family permease